MTEISKIEIVRLICIYDENQKSKILQKHQAGEGSVDSRAGGAVTTNQDVGHRKLVKGVFGRVYA